MPPEEKEELQEELVIEGDGDAEGHEGGDEGGDEGGEQPIWMQEDEGDGSSSADDGEEGKAVPLAAHLKTKRKLRAKLSEKDEELEALREENARLKAAPVEVPEAPKRPRARDFDDEDAYEDALDKYEEEKLHYSTTYAVKNTQQTDLLQKQQQDRETAVDEHYDRADKLVAEHGISPEVFTQADLTVKKIIESVLPKQGEAVFDHLVSMVGEGSEKTMFYVGRNKTAQAEFHSLLAKDPTGLKAALYLGRITERISGSKSKTSSAPAPAANLKGDVPVSDKEKGLKKKWADAHKKGNIQQAYKLKKEARKAGIDTKTWR